VSFQSIYFLHIHKTRRRRTYATRSDVTKSFCLEVLKDVEAHKAPYWIEGELTDEVREELKGECNNLVCNWEEKYNEMRPEEPCEPSPLFQVLQKCTDDESCKTPHFMVKVEK
jgi:hypothetical protein